MDKKKFGGLMAKIIAAQEEYEHAREHKKRCEKLENQGKTVAESEKQIGGVYPINIWMEAEKVRDESFAQVMALFERDSDRWDFTESIFGIYLRQKVEESLPSVRYVHERLVQGGHNKKNLYDESDGFGVAYYFRRKHEKIFCIETEDDMNLLFVYSGFENEGMGNLSLDIGLFWKNHDNKKGNRFVRKPNFRWYINNKFNFQRENHYFNKGFIYSFDKTWHKPLNLEKLLENLLSGKWHVNWSDKPNEKQIRSLYSWREEVIAERKKIPGSDYSIGVNGESAIMNYGKIKDALIFLRYARDSLSGREEA